MIQGPSNWQGFSLEHPERGEGRLCFIGNQIEKNNVERGIIKDEN
jgi:hypothetical protein